MNMKTKLTLLLTGIAALGQFAVSANEHADRSVIVVGGRNSPQHVAVAPAKAERQLAARTKAPARTQVFVGGRNAPHQVRPVSEPAFQLAPAVRKNK
jgi:hypothetical protein